MNLLTKNFTYTSLFVLVLLLSFSVKAQEPEFDLIYGQDVKAVYLSNKVKEVFVESDHYYNGSLIHPRFLSHYYLVDKRGLVVQSMSAQNYKLTQRVEYEYNNKGELVQSTLYGRSADASRDTTWKPTTRHLYIKAGKKAPGQSTWDSATGKWVDIKSDRTWIKNDTTYVEDRTRSSYPKSKSISRYYVLSSDPTIMRQDHVSFSPKGMSEPDYYYTRTKDGKMVESGKMDFEAEIMAYLQQHPEAGRLLFTKYGFNPVMDFIARHSPGKPVATRTFIYNAKGQLMEEKGYYNITYTRDSAGRVVTKISDEGIITNYYYLANGLLEGHVTSHGDGRPSESRFFRYTFQ